MHRDRQQRSQFSKSERKGVSGLRNEEQLIPGSLKEITLPVLSDPDFQSTIKSPKNENLRAILYDPVLISESNPPAVELELSRIQHVKVGGNNVENLFNIRHEKLNPQFLIKAEKYSCCCLMDSDNIKLSARLKKSSSHYTQNISGATPCLCNCAGHNQRSQIRNILRGMETNNLKISVRLK